MIKKKKTSKRKAVKKAKRKPVASKPKKKAPKRIRPKVPSSKKGPPYIYNRVKVMTEICDIIATSSKGIHEVCKLKQFPGFQAIWGWLAEEAGLEERPLSDLYSKAREAQAHFMVGETITIADEDTADVQRSRLKVGTRQWAAARLAPKKYGDRVTQEVVGDPDRPLVSNITVTFK